MEPEIPTESNGSKKKFLIIALGILVVAGAVVGYLFMQKDTPEQVSGISPVVEVKKISAIDAAKLQILRDLMTSTPASTASQAEKLSILKNLQTKTTVTKTSDTEKLKILQSLAVQ